MAKRRAKWTEQFIQKRRDQGRGLGVGSAYLPWLDTQDVSSLGVRNQILGWKTKRNHQHVSQLEQAYFYLLEWSPVVVDIREQYPLWSHHDTQAIAAQLGIAHPAFGDVVVMTSDFCITVRQSDGTQTDVIRTVKYAKDLSDSRVIEKFEIERHYWQSKGLDWGIVTELEIPNTVVENVKLIYASFRLDAQPELSPVKDDAKLYLEKALKSNYSSLAQVAATCDDIFSLPLGACLTLAKHLIATRVWRIDIHKPLNFSQKVDFLEQP